MPLPNRLQGLWRHPDFLKLWVGQTISVFGSYISGFAIPLIAVLTLGASPLQVALLGAVGMAPGFLIGLLAGVWVDRLPRRPILIATDLGRAALLLTLPIAAALDRLNVALLVVIALLTSVLSTFFDLAYRSYLPSLVRADQLVEGNSKLQATASAAEVSGFAIAGTLVQILTAPFAILADVLTFLASALALGRIRAVELPPQPSSDDENGERGALREIREGLGFVARDPILRVLAAASGIWELFRAMVGAVIILFVGRELDLAPALIGVIFGLGGISALLGAILAEPLMARLGLGRTIIAALAASGAAILFLPLAAGPTALIVACLAAQQLAGDGFATIHEIGRVSLLQSAAPSRLLGRVNASVRSLEWGSALAGLLLGGLLGQFIGLRPTLVVAALGCLIAPLWLARSSVRNLTRVMGDG